MASLASILDRPASEIKRPPAMPVGHYLFITEGLPRNDKSSQKQTEFYEFKCKYVEALDDVDQTDLQAVGGVAGKETTLTFYITEKSAYRLAEFLTDDLGLEGKTLREMIDMSPNHHFIGEIRHTPSNDGKGVYANIVKTMTAQQ